MTLSVSPETKLHTWLPQEQLGLWGTVSEYQGPLDIDCGVCSVGIRYGRALEHPQQELKLFSELVCPGIRRLFG